jgi:hypothetical protein
MGVSNQLSPGVVVQERDLTTVTAPAGFNIGVLAAPFAQGPVEEIVQIASERSRMRTTTSSGLLLHSFYPMVVS